MLGWREGGRIFWAIPKSGMMRRGIAMAFFTLHYKMGSERYQGRNMHFGRISRGLL